MINAADYLARGWEVSDCYSHLLPPGLYDRMSSDAEAAGLSSVGTRNLLHAFCLSMKPKVVLEVGAHIGNGAVAMGLALKKNNFGALYSLEPQDHYFKKLSDYVMKSELKDFVFPLQMLSNDPNLSGTIGELADIIYLDANHSYSHVYKDLEICDGLLAPNGLVLLDDVGVPHSADIDLEKRGGVRQALIDYAKTHPDWRFTFLEHPFWLNPCGLAIACKQA